MSLLRVEEPYWQQELQQLPLTWQQVPMLLLNPTPHNCSSHQQQQQQHGQCSEGAVPCTAWAARQQQQLWGSGLQAAAAASGAVVCYGPSPFPLLELFITSICVQVRLGCCKPGHAVLP
jgi:hypothetical protein